MSQSSWHPRGANEWQCQGLADGGWEPDKDGGVYLCSSLFFLRRCSRKFLVPLRRIRGRHSWNRVSAQAQLLGIHGINNNRVAAHTEALHTSSIAAFFSSALLPFSPSKNFRYSQTVELAYSFLLQLALYSSDRSLITSIDALFFCFFACALFRG